LNHEGTKGTKKNKISKDFLLLEFFFAVLGVLGVLVVQIDFGVFIFAHLWLNGF
jgi:hypothetical protein